MLMQALCVCKCFSRVRWRSVSYPGVTCVEEQAGMFNAPVLWRALGQSAQAEQDTLILYSSPPTYTKYGSRGDDRACSAQLPRAAEPDRRATEPDAVRAGKPDITAWDEPTR